MHFSSLSHWITGIVATIFIPVKLQPWFLSLRLETCLWAELRPWCLCLQWKTCPWAEHWRWWYINIFGGFISLLKYWRGHLIKWATSRHCFKHRTQNLTENIVFFSARATHEADRGGCDEGRAACRCCCSSGRSVSITSEINIKIIMFSQERLILLNQKI